MLSIATHEFKSRLKSTIIWGVCLFGFSLLFSAAHSTFSKELPVLLENFPQELDGLFGEFAQVASPEGWLGFEYYSIIIPLLLPAVAISAGASAIGDEEKNGTLELLLASPKSRVNIAGQKILSVLSQQVVLSLVLVMSIWIGKVLFDFNVSMQPVIVASCAAGFLGTFFGMSAMLVQNIFKNKSIAVGVCSVMLVVSYICHVLSQIIEDLESLKYLSAMHYYNGPKLLTGLSSEEILLIPILVITTLLIIANLIIFHLRDIK